MKGRRGSEKCSIHWEHYRNKDAQLIASLSALFSPALYFFLLEHKEDAELTERKPFSSPLPHFKINFKMICIASLPACLPAFHDGIQGSLEWLPQMISHSDAPTQKTCLTSEWWLLQVTSRHRLLCLRAGANRVGRTVLIQALSCSFLIWTSLRPLHWFVVDVQQYF